MERNILNDNSVSMRTLSSEVVRYEIFLFSKDDEEMLEEDLESCRIKCLALVTSLTIDYIWNNEGFNLCTGNTDGVSHLHGETDFGDFIEDEWLIVWLLYQITKTYPGLSCRVRDSDGEFLLIEAADYLPKWLNIDTSKNRVFVHGGHLHIVSQPSNPGEIAKLPVGQPTLKSALKAVQRHPELTQVQDDTEGSIQRRIGEFPQKSIENVQKVNVFLPEVIVRILDREPNLVSSAVRAFYHRDPIDLRACRVFKHFMPETRVWSQISMNRCGYAQLMQQIFRADKRSGYVVSKNAGADFKGMDLGCKLTHGFEILCANCKHEENNSAGTSLDETGFLKYVKALERRDYFCGEIEGSKRHTELMFNARAYFSKISSESQNNDDGISVTVGKRILDAKHKILSDTVPLRKLSSANCRLDLLAEDNDDWMYLNDEKMDEVLSEMKKGFQNLGKKNLDHTNKEEAELNDLCQKMNNFVEKFSDFEGVECLDNETPISFDAAGMQAALEKLSRFRNHSAGEDSFSDDFLSSEEEEASDSDGESHVKSIRDAIQQMDDELVPTNIGKSFIKKNENGDFVEESNESNSKLEPVDIDLNLVQNFLKSCESEMDTPGAATTLLQSIGLNADSDKR